MKVQSCAPARHSASERAPGAPEATPQPGSSCHRGAVHVTGRVPHRARPARLGHAVNGSLAWGAAVLPFLPSWGAPFPPLTPPVSTATLEGTVPPHAGPRSLRRAQSRACGPGARGCGRVCPLRVFPRRRNGLATHVSRRVPTVKRCTATINANRTATCARQSKGLIHHRGSVLTFQESDKRLGNLGNLENRLTWEHTGGGSPRGAPPPPPPKQHPSRVKPCLGRGHAAHGSLSRSLAAGTERPPSHRVSPAAFHTPRQTPQLPVPISELPMGLRGHFSAGTLRL